MHKQFHIHGIDEGKPLMAEGSFELRLWQSHQVWNSVITHTCGTWAPNWIAPVDGKAHPCPDCKEVVPDDVLTAWILHNFEPLQGYGAAQTKGG